MRVSPLASRPVAVAAALAAAIALLAMSALPASAAMSAADATPERIVLTPPQDPSTSQSITWRTGADVQDGTVSIREVGATDWRIVDATVNQSLDTDGIATRTHSATVDGLTPATEYEYFVGNATAQSDTYRFTTAGAPGDPFTFIYFGDAQNDLSAKWAPVVEQAYSKYPDAVGTVNAGDLINNSDNDSEWTDWFGAMDGYSQTTNVIAAPGNHEYSGDAFLLKWKSNFEYPADGPQYDGSTGSTPGELQTAAYEEHMVEVLAETAYFTDYQGVRFISLNASRSQAAELFTPDDLPPCLIGCPNPTELWLDVQARWLDDILANNPNKWAVAVFHQPVFSTAEGRDEWDVREAWLPVFQRNDIDLVLMGHDHTYARGFVNEDATATPGLTTGPVYAVAVSGPKYYDQQPVDDNVWTQNGATQVVRAGYTSTFQGITVTDNQIRYESIVAAKWEGDVPGSAEVPIGGVLDSFTITKYDDGTKWVTEDGVEIPAEGVPGPGTEEPEEPEVPGENPADVPLGHEVIGAITAPTATEPGPLAIDEAHGVLFTTDQSEEGTGTVQAIDVATGAVLNSFDTGGPVTDISYEPVLAAVIVSFGDGVIGAYSTASGTFGTRIVDDIPMPAPVVGVALDPGTAMLYIALANGVVLTLDVDEGELVDQTPVGAGVQRMKIDPATGNLFVAFDGADGTTGLRIFATRSDLALLGEYTLDGSAASVDIDASQGLVYVGHRNGGLSVVDLLGESTTRLDAAEYGSDIEGVAVDEAHGLVYLSSSTRTTAAVIVVGRQQAPAVLTAPKAATADAGSTVAFTAAGSGVPAPSVAWQSRTPGGEWTTIDGADSTTLEVTAKVTGTLYRAVFTNVIGGETYSTASASATLTVIGGEVPGDPEPPTGTPDAIDEALLTSATRGGVTATVANGIVTVSLNDDERIDEWVGLTLHSTPTFLGWRLVSDASTASATLPAGAAGAHRIVVLDAEGQLIGWAPVQLGSAPAPLALTGSSVPMGLVGGAILLLALGGFALLSLRRSRT